VAVVLSRTRVDRRWLWPAGAGCVVLLARQLVVPSYLPVVYGALLVLAFAAPAGVSVPARVRPLVALALGWGALLAARQVTGIGIPARSGAWTIALTTLAAVAEEGFFRRFLYGRLERYGSFVAVTTTALAFGLVHVPAYGTAAFPVDFGAGLLFSWQRWACGRWEVPAATHAAANILVMVR
jgi:membrane protease YdiL (CAAX protease family)